MSEPVVRRVHCLVLQCPVGGYSKQIHRLFHLCDVFARELAAHLHELFRRHIVLADLERLFDSNLCREPVAVPTLGKVYVEAFHPLVAGYEIDVAPVQGVSDVKVTAGIWWRCVDTVRLARGILCVEVVDVLSSPILLPLGFLGRRVVALG